MVMLIFRSHFMATAPLSMWTQDQSSPSLCLTSKIVSKEDFGTMTEMEASDAASISHFRQKVLETTIEEGLFMIQLLAGGRNRASPLHNRHQVCGDQAGGQDGGDQHGAVRFARL